MQLGLGGKSQRPQSSRLFYLHYFCASVLQVHETGVVILLLETGTLGLREIKGWPKVTVVTQRPGPASPRLHGLHLCQLEAEAGWVRGERLGTERQHFLPRIASGAAGWSPKALAWGGRVGGLSKSQENTANAPWGPPGGKQSRPLGHT